MNKKQLVVLSPFLIIGINFAIAFASKQLIGKWAFIPMILIGWFVWLYFILRFGGSESIGNWLKRPKGKAWWSFLAILIGLIPLPLFIFHRDTLSEWTIGCLGLQ